MEGDSLLPTADHSQGTTSTGYASDDKIHTVLRSLFGTDQPTLDQISQLLQPFVVLEKWSEVGPDEHELQHYPQEGSPDVTEDALAFYRQHGIAAVARKRYSENAVARYRLVLDKLGYSAAQQVEKIESDEEMARIFATTCSNVSYLTKLFAWDAAWVERLGADATEQKQFGQHLQSSLQEVVTPSFLSAIGRLAVHHLLRWPFASGPKPSREMPLKKPGPLPSGAHDYLHCLRNLGLAVVFDNALDQVMIEMMRALVEYASNVFPNVWNDELHAQAEKAKRERPQWLRNSFKMMWFDAEDRFPVSWIEKYIGTSLGALSATLRAALYASENEPSAEATDQLQQLPGSHERFAQSYKRMYEAECRWAFGHACRMLQRVRVNQFFESVQLFPGGQWCFGDLRDCIKHTGEMKKVTSAINKILHERLLHPGAQTAHIIDFFVMMTDGLRLFRSDVFLSRISHPIRRYLRTRTDTVNVIVSDLLRPGDGPRWVRREFGAHQANGGDTTWSLEAAKVDSEDESDEEQAFDANPASDTKWTPRPIDAGPNYRKTGKSDVISMLISIFDDREGFIAALERTMAEQLLKVQDYQHEEQVSYFTISSVDGQSTHLQPHFAQYLNNLTLKNRFGDSHFAKIDIMLQDVTNSRRLDAGMAAEKIMAGDDKEDITPVLQAMHPIVVSRHCWPDLSGEANDAMPGMGATTAAPSYATIPSTGNLRIPGAELAQQKLPSRFADAIGAYTEHFKRKKNTQTLRFFPGLGQFSLKLTMDSGRVIEENNLTALQASVVELAAGKGSNAVLTAGELMVELEVDKTPILNALYFWSARGVLKEVPSAAETFQVMDAW